MKTELTWVAGPAQWKGDSIEVEKPPFEHEHQYLVAVKLFDGSYDFAVVTAYCGTNCHLHLEEADETFRWDWDDIQWFTPVAQLKLRDKVPA